MSNWNKAAIALMATMLIVATVATVGLTVAVNGLNSRIDRVEETLESLALEGVRMTTGEVRGEPAQETGTITADRQTATPRPMATATPTPEPTATATLPPAPAKSSAQENICGRNPWVQQQLLAYLKMTSCRDATIEELYRLSGEYRNFPSQRDSETGGLRRTGQHHQPSSNSESRNRGSRDPCQCLPWDGRARESQSERQDSDDKSRSLPRTTKSGETRHIPAKARDKAGRRGPGRDAGTAGTDPEANGPRSC